MLSTMVRSQTYRVGMDVIVSVKELYESQINTRQVRVNVETDDSGEIVYYDLYNNKDGLVCMDGERCTVVAVDLYTVTLQNNNDERPAVFTLTYEEADISCFKSCI